MPSSVQDLLSFLKAQPIEVFDLAGRIDRRGYLARTFPGELPLKLSLQRYPGYRQMVGENWMHWHDYFEFFVALSGHGHFRSGHDRFHFAAGDMILVDPLKIHGVLEMDAAHTALVVLFPRHLVAAPGTVVDQGYLAPWEQRAPDVHPILARHHPGSAQVHAAMLALSRAWFGESNGRQRSLRLKLELLNTLLCLGNAIPLASTPPATDADRARQEERLRLALDYMDRHLHEPLNQPAVAKAVGMSVSRFRAFFKETTGWGFAQYVREQRVERAARLLRESAQSVAEIAHAAGFADQSHLLRCMRAKYGQSPTAYRCRHQKTGENARA